MPNIKSAKKRVLVSKIQNESNRSVKSALKTSIKKFDAAVESGADVASAAFNVAVSGVDKAVSKGVIHKNTAARRKSQMAKKLNAVK